jgi:hypothetical protein
MDPNLTVNLPYLPKFSRLMAVRKTFEKEIYFVTTIQKSSGVQEIWKISEMSRSFVVRGCAFSIGLNVEICGKR